MTDLPIDIREIRRIVRIATSRTGSAVFDEDLMQDAALRAIEAFRRAGDVRHPRAFLRKVVTDAVRDHWRGRRNVENLDSVAEERVAETPRFEDRIDFERRAQILRGALNCLNASRRRIVELFYLEERSAPEIAALLNRTPSAVKMELARARRQLAGALEIVADKDHKKSR